MPKYGAPKVENPRLYKVGVMVTAEELALIDLHRGEQTRSSYGRQCILQSFPQYSNKKPKRLKS